MQGTVHISSLQKLPTCHLYPHLILKLTTTCFTSQTAFGWSSPALWKSYEDPLLTYTRYCSVLLQHGIKAGPWAPCIGGTYCHCQWCILWWAIMMYLTLPNMIWKIYKRFLCTLAGTFLGCYQHQWNNQLLSNTAHWIGNTNSPQKWVNTIYFFPDYFN